LQILETKKSRPVTIVNNIFFSWICAFILIPQIHEIENYINNPGLGSGYHGNLPVSRWISERARQRKEKEAVQHEIVNVLKWDGFLFPFGLVMRARGEESPQEMGEDARRLFPHDLPVTHRHFFEIQS